MLPCEVECSLTEVQRVYIFGFPKGSALGKEITVSESSVSSLRKDSEGSLSQIQVNGGMQPGNSGGPVVDAGGAVLTTVFAATTSPGPHGGYGVANATVRADLAAVSGPVSTEGCTS